MLFKLEYYLFMYSNFSQFINSHIDRMNLLRESFQKNKEYDENGTKGGGCLT